jgi:hypothetical protein
VGGARAALGGLARDVAAPAGPTLVVNPTMRARSDVVEVTIAGSGSCVLVDAAGIERPTQVLEEFGGEEPPIVVRGQKVRWVLDTMRGTEFQGRQIAAYEMHGTEIRMREAAPGEDRCDLAALKAEILALGERGAEVRFVLTHAPARRVLFETGRIEGFGWSSFTARDGRSSTGDELRIDVDHDDGTFSIELPDGLRVDGLGRLVDGGDGGDTYNYSAPDRDRIVDRPDDVAVTMLESGPARARVRIDAIYTVPARANGDHRRCTSRSDETVPMRVRTTLERRVGEPFLRVTHDIDNHARDHRLRAHFPLPAPVDGSDAECAFTVVHRGLTAEGGPHEFGLPTFPSRRFVDASKGDVGLALLHNGLLEYEIIDGRADAAEPRMAERGSHADGGSIALTLLRAVGYLSRTEPQLRPNAAGPPFEVERPQVQGYQRVQYAVLLHRGDWREADCYGAADAFTVPFEHARVTHRGDATRPARGSALAIEGAELSAVTRVAGGLVVRLFRTDPTEGSARVEHEGTPARGYVVDLRGRPIARFEGEVTLRPWEIATLQIA